MPSNGEAKRIHPNRWKPDEEEALAEQDPLDKISEEMAGRGFATLWTVKPKTPQSTQVMLQFDDKSKQIYLRKLATTGRHAYSCACAGFCRSTVNTHKRRDPIFAAAIEEALEYFRDLLQGEMIRRGVEGFDEEVIGGRNRDKIFKVKKYSDRMLELLGRIHIPQMNTQRLPSTAPQTVVDNSQNMVVNNSFDLETMPADELAVFKQLVENQAKRKQKEQDAEDKVIDHES